MSVTFSITDSTLRACIAAAGLTAAHYFLKPSADAKAKAAGAKGPPCIVLVDPISTGAYLGHEILEKNVPCIRVFSQRFPPALASHIKDGLRTDYVTTITHQDNYDYTVRQIQSLPFEVAGVVTGCETGVICGDELAERLGVAGNATESSLARRDKYLMGEKVRAAGVRAVKQQYCDNWKDIEEFVRGWNPDPFQLILKPTQSAGTDGVFLCRSWDDIREAWAYISDGANESALGHKHVGVVVQEFMQGPEYVIDSVSLNGVHKCVSLWVYDRQSINGKDFVLHEVTLLSADTERGQALIKYMHSVLDALGVRHGPSHGEVMWLKDGPCLVEVGARPHGGDGTWAPIPIKCLGYSQITVSCDILTEPRKFEDIPLVPKLTHTFGTEVYIPSFVNGVLRKMPYLDDIRALESFVSMNWTQKCDRPIAKTIDCMTLPGSVTLVNKSKENLTRDVATLRALGHKEDFFVTQEMLEKKWETDSTLSNN